MPYTDTLNIDRRDSTGNISLPSPELVAKRLREANAAASSFLAGEVARGKITPRQAQTIAENTRFDIPGADVSGGSGAQRRDGGKAPLGNIRKFVEGGDDKNQEFHIYNKDLPHAAMRRKLYKNQAEAARLLATSEISKQVRKCLCKLIYGEDAVNVLKRENRARYDKLVLCKDVWACPVCSRNKSRANAMRINYALEWARKQPRDEQGLTVQVAMMTLTARHSRRTKLNKFLTALLAAKRAMFGRAAWRRLKAERVVGFITALESTWSAHKGWHPHFHILVFIRATDQAGAIALLEELRVDWKGCARKQGLTMNAHGFDLRGASAAGHYVAKFGAGTEVVIEDRSGVKRESAAAEMALNDTKRGKGDGSMNPWQLLEASRKAREKARMLRRVAKRHYEAGEAAQAARGEKLAAEAEKAGRQPAALFVEFAETFKGRTQLDWSNGFRDLVGVEAREQEAKEKADVERAEGPDEVMFAAIARPDWIELMKVRFPKSRLLEIAEQDTDAEEDFWEAIEEAIGKPPQRSHEALAGLKVKHEQRRWKRAKGPVPEQA
ncbi:protein rep [Sagittula stellata]|uniref:Rep protein n=1 Tax=Sagittula stellata (strain ATCC 700073 / DSM 11524 / E-37) TaxID=388399 RepID=A3K8F3_SAGS3|nr:protein rep [Sagittula stellata]EBA06632.1 Rep protein [Sagittula stellata E-37]